MKYKIKILSKGQIWGDVEWREVDEDGLYKIQTAAYTGKFGREERLVHELDLDEYDRSVATPVVGEDGLARYLVPKEYAIQVEDITLIVEERERKIKEEEEDKRKIMKEVKLLVKNIDEIIIDTRIKRILTILTREVFGKEE